MGFCTAWSWDNQDDDQSNEKVFCQCGKSHKKWLEEEGLIGFIKKDTKKRQLCRLSTCFSDEKLFEHVVHEKSYGSLVHLGLIRYL